MQHAVSRVGAEEKYRRINPILGMGAMVHAMYQVLCKMTVSDLERYELTALSAET